MHDEGGGGLGLPDSGVSVTLIDWAGDCRATGPETASVGACIRVGVGVGERVGVAVGLLVRLRLGSGGGLSTELSGVAVAVGVGFAVAVAVAVGVAVGGAPVTVKETALLATTVSVPSMVAITSTRTVYPDSSRGGQDPDTRVLITNRLPSLFGMMRRPSGQLPPWQLGSRVKTESFRKTQARTKNLEELESYVSYIQSSSMLIVTDVPVPVWTGSFPKIRSAI